MAISRSRILFDLVSLIARNAGRGGMDAGEAARLSAAWSAVR